MTTNIEFNLETLYNITSQEKQYQPLIDWINSLPSADKYDQIERYPFSYQVNYYIKYGNQDADPLLKTFKSIKSYSDLQPFLTPERKNLTLEILSETQLLLALSDMEILFEYLGGKSGWLFRLPFNYEDKIKRINEILDIYSTDESRKKILFFFGEIHNKSISSGLCCWFSDSIIVQMMLDRVSYPVFKEFLDKYHMSMFFPEKETNFNQIYSHIQKYIDECYLNDSKLRVFTGNSQFNQPFSKLIEMVISRITCADTQNLRLLKIIVPLLTKQQISHYQNVFSNFDDETLKTIFGKKELNENSFETFWSAVRSYYSIDIENVITAPEEKTNYIYHSSYETGNVGFLGEINGVGYFYLRNHKSHDFLHTCSQCFENIHYPKTVKSFKLIILSLTDVVMDKITNIQAKIMKKLTNDSWLFLIGSSPLIVRKEESVNHFVREKNECESFSIKHGDRGFVRINFYDNENVSTSYGETELQETVSMKERISLLETKKKWCIYDDKKVSFYWFDNIALYVEKEDSTIYLCSLKLPKFKVKTDDLETFFLDEKTYSSPFNDSDFNFPLELKNQDFTIKSELSTGIVEPIIENPKKVGFFNKILNLFSIFD